MDIAAALSRLDPWFEHLHGVVHHGFEQYRAYPPSVLIEHDARATAACIYIHMWREAERRFAEGARSVAATVEVRGLSLVALGDFALIRFKKMDEDGNTRNYPTPQAEAFDAQEVIEGLPPAAVRLSVGYLADASATQIEQVIVAKPNGRAPEWAAAINPASSPRWIDITRQRRFSDEYLAASTALARGVTLGRRV